MWDCSGESIDHFEHEECMPILVCIFILHTCRTLEEEELHL